MNTTYDLFSTLDILTNANIFSLADLQKNQDFYNLYWITAYDFVKQNTYKHSNKVQHLCYAYGCNYEEIVTELTIKFVTSYKAIATAYFNSDPDKRKHYLVCSLHRQMTSLYRKVSEKVMIDDIDPKTGLPIKDPSTGQNKKKEVYSAKVYKADSLDATITNAGTGSSYCLSDITPDKRSTPEEVMESRFLIMHYLDSLVPNDMYGFVTKSLGYSNEELRLYGTTPRSRRQLLNELLDPFAKEYDCPEAVIYKNLYTDDDFIYDGVMHDAAFISHTRTAAKNKLKNDDYCKGRIKK